MITVYKYPLDIVDEQLIRIPACSKLLCVKVQDGTPMLWAQIDTEQPVSEYQIIVAGTGNPMSAYHVYIDTFTSHGDKLVWHVFHGYTRPIEIQYD